MKRGKWVIGVLLAGLIVVSTLGVTSGPGPGSEPPYIGGETIVPDETGPPQGSITSMLEPFFMENRGQLDDDGIRYYSHGEGISIGFCTEEVLYSKRDPAGETAFRVEFEGCEPVEPESEDPLGHPTSFFHGPERDWVVGAGSMGRIAYKGLWEGVDVVYYFKGPVLKYDVSLASGADPSIVRLRYVGVEGLSVDGVTGELVVDTLAGELREDAPIAFQEIGDSRSEIDCRFEVVDTMTLGFHLGRYDPTIPLVIDPGLSFSTFVGGSSGEDIGGMFVDSAGSIYVGGSTYSNDFPAKTGAYDTSLSGNRDTFVFKLASDGGSLVYATYIGGDLNDIGQDICVDSSGCAYITGLTGSDSYPTTPGAYDRQVRGSDVFVTKLNATGTGLVFSTFIGGVDSEGGYAISLDASDNPCVFGGTNGNLRRDFPTTSGCYDPYFNGGATDGFFAKVNASGDKLLYSTHIGGSDIEYIEDMVAVGSDIVYLVGFTASNDFPTTVGAYDTRFSDDTDTFITKLNLSSSKLEYSTYVGGGNIDNAHALYVDGDGNVYVTGITDGFWFPTTAGAYQSTWKGRTDAYVLKMNPSGTDLVYSTYLGRSSTDTGEAIWVDDDGHAFVLGYTFSSDFPTTENALCTTWSGGMDVFLIELDEKGSALEYSTLIGGALDDLGYCLFLDESVAYIGGDTRSTDFPVTQGAFSTSHSGSKDIFILEMDIEPPVLSDLRTDPVAFTGDPFNLSVNATDNEGLALVQVEYWQGSEGDHERENMTITTGTVTDGTWNASVNASLNSTAELHFIVHGWDAVGMKANTLNGSVEVYDNDGPDFESLTPSSATTGDLFELMVRVTDNINVHVVGVEYNDTHQVYSRLLTHGTGDVWNLTIPIPSDAVNLSYMIYAFDNSSNYNSTGIIVIPVVDDDPPTFGEDASPDTAETDLSYTFSVPVEDNIGVETVWVEFWYGNGTRTNANMELEGSVWEHWMIVADTLEDLHYIIWSNDTSGNVASTVERVVDVIDINGPHIINEGTKSWATTGDPFEFTLTAHDNVGLKSATLWYALDDGELVPFEMEVVAAYPSSGNTLYSLWIDVPSDQSENITYSYEIEDLYGNVFLTHVDIIRVRDDDDPSIVEDLTPGEARMGETFSFMVKVSDNVGIDIVEVQYALGDGDPVTAQMSLEGTDGVHTLTIEVAVDEPGPISYHFRVMDLGWNEVNGTTHHVQVVDAILPEIVNVTWSEPLKGINLEVVLKATDNVGVVQASVRYWFGDGTHFTVGLDEFLTAFIDIPREADGDLHLMFAVRDEADNWFVSEETLVPLLNAAPTVDPVPLWEVIEDVDTYLDLAPFISDANDDLSSLTMSCEDGTVTVEGLKLRALYVFPFPDRTVDLTVSDGEDETDFQITIHIVDVNDAPVIIDISPVNGTKYKEGKVVTMSVTANDEDGDDLTVTWTEGGTTLGTGATLDYKKLKPGIRTIKVTVSDGEAIVEDEFTVVITKEEESPMLGGVFVLLAMLVGMAATMMRRKGRL